MTAEAIGTWLVTPASPDRVLGPLGLLYLLVFGGGFVIAAYLAGPAARRLAATPDRAAPLARRATIGMAVFGAGLFLLGMRLLQLDGLPFGWPLWPVAAAIAGALYLVQCWRWWRSASSPPPLPAGYRVPTGYGAERGSGGEGTPVNG